MSYYFFMCVVSAFRAMRYKFSPHGSLVLSGGMNTNKVRKHEHLEGTVTTKMASRNTI